MRLPGQGGPYNAARAFPVFGSQDAPERTTEAIWPKAGLLTREEGTVGKEYSGGVGSTRSGVREAETLFDPLQAMIHLGLHAFAVQIVAAQGIDLFADADKLVAVVGERFFDFAYIGLKLLQDFVDEIVCHFGQASGIHKIETFFDAGQAVTELVHPGVVLGDGGMNQGHFATKAGKAAFDVPEATVHIPQIAFKALLPGTQGAQVFKDQVMRFIGHTFTLSEKS